MSELKIIGIRPPDEKWKKMKAIFNNCQELDIDVPEEVAEFFDRSDPTDDEGGVEINLERRSCCWRLGGRPERVFMIEVGRIPSDIKTIRISYPLEATP